MILTGIADEAGARIETQIKATKELGWEHIEARSVEVEGFPKANLHDIDDAAFDIVEKKLKESGVKIYAFGSTIANWGKKIDDPFDLSDVERAIPRMQRLGTKYVRIMSYAVREGEDQMEAERFRRINEITKRFVDAGLTPVHENCMNYGGMSWQHAQKLRENVPG
ncbi:MAG: TIM barrel protein, partial [Boseongicola sp.]|nr:TIM barrel protein [Boseongicola sp.]